MENLNLKIVSGAQTGADWGALDWAISRGISHGGWCPKGRLAEDGTVAECYELNESTSPQLSPAHRMERKGLGWDSYFHNWTDANWSKKTAEFAKKHKKPWLHLTADNPLQANVQQLRELLTRHQIRVLNVAEVVYRKNLVLGEALR